MGSRGGVGNRALQRRLRDALYRFDCPSPHSVGEYVLDVLAEPSRSRLARHVLDCAFCTSELREARTFLTTRDPVVPMPGMWQGLRQVVASLFTPTVPRAYAPVRGSVSGSGSEYRAGPVKIIIGDVPGRRRGTVSIDGLLLRDDGPPDAVADREVKLQAADGHLQTTRTDDLGGFVFEDVAHGTYALAVEFPEELVIVEGIRAGR